MTPIPVGESTHQRAQFIEYCRTHFARAHLGFARLHDVTRAQTLFKNTSDRLVDKVGLLSHIERIA